VKKARIFHEATASERLHSSEGPSIIRAMEKSGGQEGRGDTPLAFAYIGKGAKAFSLRGWEGEEEKWSYK